MVDGCAHHGQSNRDVYTGLDAQHLDRSVTLVVVHGDDAIEVSARRPEEERIGRQRPFHLPSALQAFSNCRFDLLFLFSVSEEAVLTGVRVDGADANARAFDAGFDQGFLCPLDGALHQARVDGGYGIDQADVRGDMDDPEFGCHQQHADFLGAGEIGEHLGVSGKDVSRHVQGFLVERGGADGVRLFGKGQPGGAFDKTVGGFSAGGRQFSEGKIGRNHGDVDHVHRTRRVLAVGGLCDSIEGEIDARDLAGLTQASEVANDQRAATVKQVCVGKALHDDFGSDPGGIAHGDRDNWT